MLTASLLLIASCFLVTMQLCPLLAPRHWRSCSTEFYTNFSCFV